ncbi:MULTISPECIES: TIGR03617 family F420-dependent LLM class oxidoreductase [unclassified Rhodococcus (in: high G+C Gram-positive bacteria)]|uniref:TIGR03617 family F420-dependent LLM class oxidoreductase n=1 Tax=unclassified Rhodococcus (in: high G+C Gram-positive bacteria) TaxID=192944 RepID=UPI000BD719C5|nr:MULTISPECIES: TIGR03617 family F420-dependent LLM class oxidoreductase [unclassified Rhodococcus (in: high G+C Gram-positive bacteria)]MBP1161945.1 putative F420-dependent oxidoreductase [Rhodococcus sp. PvR099]PTR43345.1 putative F420-dependent oxidoreductase [Rhodococcus sp. OK611]SNX91208.1 probable F420-dependent oxidoreductase, MSMEG_2256 family [Rhodococcus sp. OK270]
MKVDVQLDGRPEDAAARARELVALGADGLFTFEGAHDVFVPLIAASGVVEADLMTNVAIALPRSPMHLAHTANDLQTLSRGRFRLGLGSQIRPHIERRYGTEWSKPAARMREMVLAIKAIFAAWEGGAPLKFQGEFTTHTLMPPTFNPGPNPYGPPEICLGALGPLMTRAAAEVADGLLVMPFNSARHFRERTLPSIEEGLELGGRSRSDLAIYPQIIVGTGRTPDELDAAARGVRRLLAFYGSTPAYRPVLEVEGWADVQPELNVLSKRGEVAAMTELIDTTMMTTLAVHGTPEQCAAEIVARFGDHADRVCCYFPGYPVSNKHVAELISAIQTARP